MVDQELRGVDAIRAICSKTATEQLSIFFISISVWLKLLNYESFTSKWLFLGWGWGRGRWGFAGRGLLTKSFLNWRLFWQAVYCLTGKDGSGPSESEISVSQEASSWLCHSDLFTLITAHTTISAPSRDSEVFRFVTASVLFVYFFL